MSRERLRIYAAQIAVLVVWLLLWELVPTLLKPLNIVLLNPVFISTPSKIAADLVQITFVNGLIFPASGQRCRPRWSGSCWE